MTILFIKGLMDDQRSSIRWTKGFKNFLADEVSIQEAITACGNAVRSGTFPAPEHCFK